MLTLSCVIKALSTKGIGSGNVCLMTYSLERKQILGKVHDAQSKLGVRGMRLASIPDEAIELLVALRQQLCLRNAGCVPYLAAKYQKRL